MTWAPAPMAKSISVAVGDNDTIAFGLAGDFDGTPSTSIETGNGSAAALGGAVVVGAADLVAATTRHQGGERGQGQGDQKARRDT